MQPADLDDIAERLFAFFVAWDLDAVANMLAPQATITQNGRTTPAVEALAAIGALRSVIGDHRYVDVRRTFGERTVVEEHRVVSTTPAGVAVDLSACVVIRVDDSGMITSLDEYVDTAPLLR